MKGEWCFLENHPDDFHMEWVDEEGNFVYAFGNDDSCDPESFDSKADKRWARWHRLAVKLVVEAGLGGRTRDGSVLFKSEKDGKRALRIINACRKLSALADESLPLPEWAIKAQAEGWKAPKGWTP